MPVNQDQLLLGESLRASQFLSSMNGRYNFVYQDDGNLVLYKVYRNQPWRPLWASNTAGSSVGSTQMQSDGNTANSRSNLQEWRKWRCRTYSSYEILT
jgi:hypothetical protein